MFRLAATAELIIQPHIAPTSGGGSGSSGNDCSWNGEDKEKKQNYTDGGDNDDKQKYFLQQTCWVLLA